VTGEEKPDWPPLPLYHEDGTQNLNMVAVAAALQGEVINISDVYHDERYDFSGTKEFDAMTGYRSGSMLVIPMKDHEEKVIGVLQLINRTEEGEIVPFSREDEQITQSLASQAAILIHNQILIHDLEEMLFSFLNALAETLDNKSAFTGRHIKRMVDVTMEIAKAIRDDRKGRFKTLSFSEDEMKQIYLAALVHDIGKIVTPDYLVEKSTKLETVFDRIENIRLRMELAKSQYRASFYKQMLENMGVEPDTDDSSLEMYEARLDDWMRFIEEANRGNEYFSDEKVARLKEINDAVVLNIDDKKVSLFEPDELEALSVQRGTLTMEERRIIMDHVKETQRNLNQLNFPSKYRRIPEIAGAHHEKLNGTGYPDGLDAEQISLEARILAIADIFEALTASDRPYKKPNKLSEAMRILYSMAKEGELDYEIVKFFYEEKIYLKYAEKHLHEEQIDEVHLEF
jgi:HD-GYP domain-containing protein (c-di-GMP phosphodiesterase class II)